MKLLQSFGLCMVIVGMTSCKTTQGDESGLESKGRREGDVILQYAKETPCREVPPNFRPDGGLNLEPNKNLTPGVLCQNPSHRSYFERIPRCERDVTDGTKNRTFHAYQDAGLLSHSYLNHSGFKIDHLIPLCMGGDNDIKNLWPQHDSIGEFTDPVEKRLCAAMDNPNIKMLQKDAITIIRGVKNDYKTAYNVCMDLNRKLGINL